MSSVHIVSLPCAVVAGLARANTWSDPKLMPGNQTSTGVPPSQPGVALRSPPVKGQLLQVTAPNKNIQILPQIDTGPGTRTQRGVDISAAAAEKFGYTPKTFPTDQPFLVQPIIQAGSARGGRRMDEGGDPGSPDLSSSMAGIQGGAQTEAPVPYPDMSHCWGPPYNFFHPKRFYPIASSSQQGSDPDPVLINW
jgi:hypothetical protein